MRSWFQGSLALLIILSFSVAGMPVASANPAVPMCGPASVLGATSVTAEEYDPQDCVETTGRVFPEALADPDYIVPEGPNGFTCADPEGVTGGSCTGFASDYVSYFEFQQGLDYLAAQYPEYIEVHEVAMSHGMDNVLGGPSSNPIYMLEISNEDSPIPRDQKQNMLFMLSIHGNEKGGREGGFRVAEDLLRNIGFATETVQNGAGMSPAIPRPTGEGEVQTYHDYLDFMNVFLLFPNADGWACDELEYGTDGCPGLFRRQNANGVDLNRQTPTMGWNRQGSPSHEAVKEPESVGYVNWMIDQREQSNGTFQWDYAIDIHGMLNHKNFGAIMLPAGSFSPQEMHRSLKLAETLKERWNADPHFEEWRTLFEGAESAWANSAPARGVAATGADALCGTVDCPFVGSGLGGTLRDDESATTEVSSSQFAEYYTVIDAIGYTDSGFSGDFFAQDTGLNAPGYDIELAYNHLNCSAQYECGALFNDYHVWMVRHIVKSFMDAAAVDGQISYETGGQKTAYVVPQYVATNLDDVDEDGEPRLSPGGWADENPNDDYWQYSEDQPFEARPAKYWEDIAPFLCENCGDESALPGTLTSLNAQSMSVAEFRDALAPFDSLVIPNTAINQFVDGEWSANEVATGDVATAKLDVILEWVDAGGKLVLTDAALEFFDLAGLTENAVEMQQAYMGGIRMDLDHPMLDKVRGGVKQTYEPTPLGYGITGTAPNWGIDPAAFAALDGSVAGLVCGGSSLDQNCQGQDVSLGYVDHGAGQIKIMGAILPDPTEEFYHPYGLDDYATTYSGNQIIRNMLEWDEVFSAPPITITGDGEIVQTKNERVAVNSEGLDGAKAGSDKGSPGIGLVAIAAALGAALFAARRR